jgi:hypothetical protein
MSPPPGGLAEPAQFNTSNAGNATTLLVVYSMSTDVVNAMDRLNADLKRYQTRGVVIDGAAVQSGPSNNVDVQVTGANQAGSHMFGTYLSAY